MNFPVDDNGNPLQGLTERQVRGQLAAVRAILESIGYSGGEIEAGVVTDDWFLTSANGGRKAYIEFVPGQQGVQGSYNKVVRWMNKATFEALTAAGTQAAAPAAAAAPAKTAAPNPVVVSNGAAAPAIQDTLPPPPSAAQSIVS